MRTPIHTIKIPNRTRHPHPCTPPARPSRPHLPCLPPVPACHSVAPVAPSGVGRTPCPTTPLLSAGKWGLGIRKGAQQAQHAAVVIAAPPRTPPSAKSFCKHAILKLSIHHPCATATQYYHLQSCASVPTRHACANSFPAQHPPRNLFHYFPTMTCASASCVTSASFSARSCRVQKTQE